MTRCVTSATLPSSAGMLTATHTDLSSHDRARSCLCPSGPRRLSSSVAARGVGRRFKDQGDPDDTPKPHPLRVARPTLWQITAIAIWLFLASPGLWNGEPTKTVIEATIATVFWVGLGVLRGFKARPLASLALDGEQPVASRVGQI